MSLSPEARSLDAHLFVAEDKLARLTEAELRELLAEIGYGAPAIDLLVTYQTMIKTIREKLGFTYKK
ncbi:MAG: hypothetical protein LBI11_00995 [Streptococcaceae bacterium]|jgi:hypothetical protein|nr:hypothetical protein [Streptococcaceae bacterium]